MLEKCRAKRSTQSGGRNTKLYNVSSLIENWQAKRQDYQRSDPTTVQAASLQKIDEQSLHADLAKLNHPQSGHSKHASIGMFPGVYAREPHTSRSGMSVWREISHERKWQQWKEMNMSQWNGAWMRVKFYMGLLARAPTYQIGSYSRHKNWGSRLRTGGLFLVGYIFNALCSRNL